MFLKLGLFTFGGGYAMIAIIQRDLVEKKNWLTEEELADMLIVSESTPGPIIINTATYVGYKIWGVAGGIVATIGSVIPPLVVISLLYSVLDVFSTNKWVNAAFRGVHCAVVVLLVNAIVTIVKPMKKTVLTIGIGVVSFFIALFTDFNSIWLILIGGVIGILISVCRRM